MREVEEVGRVREVMPEHPVKADSLTEVSEAGIVREVIPLQ